jgi:hypothetical protein
LISLHWWSEVATIAMRQQSLCYLLFGLMLAAVSATSAGGDTEKTIYLVQEDRQITAINSSTGQFFDLEIRAKEEIEQQVVAKSVAIVATNQRFAGIGGLPGGWSSKRRQAGEALVRIEAEDSSAVVVTSSRVLVFNGRAGAWAEKRRAVNP